MRMEKILPIILIAWTSVLIVSSFALYWFITGSGTIHVTPNYELTAYEQGTTTPCTDIDWGTLQRGYIATNGITIVNTGTGNFTDLNMTYTMSPSTVGTISWDIEGSPLSVGASVDVTLTLTVAVDAPEGDFTCEIHINANRM